jgi:hypothetical protein
MAGSTDIEAPGGGDWKPIIEAFKLMHADGLDYEKQSEFLTACRNGAVRLAGKHSNGWDETGERLIELFPPLQEYEFIGLLPILSSEDLKRDIPPRLPLLLRIGAELPETIFPPWRSRAAKNPPGPKAFAYTDCWFDLRYDSGAFKRWLRGEANPDAAVPTSSIGNPAQAHRGRPKGSGSYDKFDSLLIDEMQTLISNGDAKSPNDAARQLLHKIEGSGSDDSRKTRLVKKYYDRFKSV